MDSARPGALATAGEMDSYLEDKADTLMERNCWRQAFELNKPFLFIIGVRGGRFGGLVYPLIL